MHVSDGLEQVICECVCVRMYDQHIAVATKPLAPFVRVCACVCVLVCVCVLRGHVQQIHTNGVHHGEVSKLERHANDNHNYH